MNEAPPILSPLEFAGMENRLILIEMEESDQQLNNVIDGKTNIIFTVSMDEDHPYGMLVMCDSLHIIHKTIKLVGDAGVDFYVIRRVDLMNLHLSKKDRGSQVKAYISMIACEKNLRGANLIVTSCSTEYKLREMADVFINLK